MQQPRAKRVAEPGQQRAGELYAFASVLLWSLFPFLVHRELNPLTPLFTAAFSTLLAVVPLGCVLALRGRWRDLTVRAAWMPMLHATLLIGVLFYGLLFWAARRTSPINISLLALIEVPLSFLLLSSISSERPTRLQTWGAAAMLFGAVVILSPWKARPEPGDIVVIVACLLPPFGNYCAKQARLLVGAETILLVRSAISGLLLLAAAWALEPPPSGALIGAAMPFVLLNGILLMGISKIFWTEALYRLPIPKAVSSFALGPPLTMVLSFALLKQPPTAAQWIALLPVCGGVLLVVRRTG